MPKRTGYIYERMTSWEAVREAEQVSLRNKAHNTGYRKHETHWLSDLIEVHEMVLQHRMKTGRYRHDIVRSPNGKVRDIAKLDFHPSHVEHQLLVLAGNSEVERSFVRHTYACRIGYGQHRAARQLNRWVQQYGEAYPWFVHLDVVKYYDNIPHALIRQELERTFKDRTYIDSLMETVEQFSTTGRGIPLGIRPAQLFGNLALRSVDRYAKEVLHIRCYLRYLDDSVALFRTKAEARRKTRQLVAFYRQLGFELHDPRISPLRCGIDMLGYVCYPRRGLFIRRRLKADWLRRRSHVTNPRRLREIDSAAWSVIAHGNKHCQILYKKMGGIPFSKLGIDPGCHADKNGVRIIDAQNLSMQMIIGKAVTILDVVDGVTTKHGEGRTALLIDCMGTTGKLILNAPCKQTILNAWKAGVTKMQTVFIDHGGRHYDIDLQRTYALEINHNPVDDTRQ